MQRQPRQIRQYVMAYRPRRWAIPFHASFRRWKVLVLHRRAGKTVASLAHHILYATNDKLETSRLRACSEHPLTDAQIRPLLKRRHYGHILPTRVQAKLVAWEILKEMARSAHPDVQTNESELRVDFPNGNRIQLFGADNPDSLRGPAFSGLSFDEFQLHPPNIFSEVLSKALADHLGYAIFAGTIKGKNQLYQQYHRAKEHEHWFALWQDVDVTLATEDDSAVLMVRQAMEDDKALVAMGEMTQDEFDQEWHLSPTASIKGAFYSKQMSSARQQGRIGNVPIDPTIPVDTDWDLGMNDKMSVWFTQSLRTGEVRAIAYHETEGEGFPYWVGVLSDFKKKFGINYGKHYAPHDIKVRELGTGKSRLEQAAELGLDFEIVQRIGLMDGINATRAFLSKVYFDQIRCEIGLECLSQYRKKWNEHLKQFDGTPVHDWASNGADAFRGLAVRHRDIEPDEKPRPRQPFESYQANPLHWMA